MRTRISGKNLTTMLLLLFVARDLSVAQDSASAIENPLPAPTQQVAPAQAVLPQDVPQAVVPTPTATPLVATDQEFLRKALAVITAERELGKLASERGETEEVKALGRELLASQVKNGAALQELAKIKNFELNLPPSNPQQDGLASFQEKVGASFDSAFREHVAQDRSQSIQIFAAGAKSTKDPAVRGLAEKMLAELKKERPLAAAEAAETAQKSREISKVALKPKAAKPAAQQEAKGAGTTVGTNVQSPVAPSPSSTGATPSPIPPASTPVASPTAARTTEAATTRVQPAGNYAPGVATTSVSTGAPAAASTSAPTAGSPAPIRREKIEQPAPRASTNEPIGTVRSTDGRPAPPPSISRSTEPATAQSNPAATQPSRIVESAPAEGVQYSTSGVIIEAPAEASNHRVPRTVTKPARGERRSATSDGTQYSEDRTKVVPKKRTTVTIQEAPRPRVVRRVNEEEGEEDTVNVAPPRKVIRRKIFQSSDDDNDEED